ncbi:hypothetical protein [Pantoea ananatis]|uniref:hypothetical protein n=1 Tax=Pantoea ananas TaxID=553 RepID=UPI001B3048C3|nr:hypothetical protein [Pantoea ananatis]
MSYLLLDYLPVLDFYNKIKPFLSDDYTSYFSSLQAKGDKSVVYMAAIEFVLLLFFITALIKTPSLSQRKIVNKLSVSKIISYGKVNLFSYFGSIKEIRKIEVVVTSENSELELARLSSTSISGRVRYMAALKDEFDDIVHDSLYESVKNYKVSKNKSRYFKLGTCIVSPPFELVKYDVKCVIHAVSVQKKDDNSIVQDDYATKRILSYVINHCIENSYSSVFIPIFGIGSAQGHVKESVLAQLDSLKIIIDNEMERCNSRLDVYLGVYRELDDLMLKKTLVSTFK